MWLIPLVSLLPKSIVLNLIGVNPPAQSIKTTSLLFFIIRWLIANVIKMFVFPRLSYPYISVTSPLPIILFKETIFGNCSS